MMVNEYVSLLYSVLLYLGNVEKIVINATWNALEC